MTEQPISFERPETGVDPAEPRGALVRTSTPSTAHSTPSHSAAGDARGGTALPAQARTGETPSTPGTTAPSGPSKEPSDIPGNGPEHSQPSVAAEPDTHRPRPVP
ncbi:serine/threonine protein phosphatase, partial [Streptomyces sp. T21Q-yed]|nr:serine/threonine protein phosphatase [Streptomyces sp. T21Q-yed]